MNTKRSLESLLNVSIKQGCLFQFTITLSASSIQGLNDLAERAFLIGRMSTCRNAFPVPERKTVGDSSRPPGYVTVSICARSQINYPAVLSEIGRVFFSAPLGQPVSCLIEERSPAVPLNGLPRSCYLEWLRVRTEASLAQLTFYVVHGH